VPQKAQGIDQDLNSLRIVIKKSINAVSKAEKQKGKFFLAVRFYFFTFSRFRFFNSKNIISEIKKHDFALKTDI
jgi:hypothetical protein